MPYVAGNRTDNKVWLSFPVPDDTYFVGAFQGAIAALCFSYNWEQTTNDATPEEAAEYGCYASEEMIKSMPQELVTGVRIVGTEIEIRDAEGNWAPAGELCVNCNSPSESLAPEFDSEGHLCAAVTQSCEWLYNFQTDYLDRADLYLSGANTVAQMIIGLAEAFTLGAAELLPIDEVATAVYQLNALLIQNVRNSQQTAQFLEDVQEDLYCRIKQAGQPYTLTEVIYNDWASQYDTVPPNPAVYGGTWGYLAKDFVGFQQFLDRYKLYSYDVENDCELSFSCGGDCYELNFETMPSLPPEISFLSGFGTFVQGKGIEVDPQFDLGFGAWVGRANVTFTGAPGLSAMSDMTFYVDSNIVSLLKTAYVNFWTNGSTVIQGEESYGAGLSQMYYQVTTNIESPDFTCVILWGTEDSSAAITAEDFHIKKLVICGNQLLLDWLASIDTN